MQKKYIWCTILLRRHQDLRIYLLKHSVVPTEKQWCRPKRNIIIAFKYHIFIHEQSKGKRACVQYINLIHRQVNKLIGKDNVLSRPAKMEVGVLVCSDL
jgi:hypothetical protein